MGTRSMPFLIFLLLPGAMWAQSAAIRHEQPPSSFFRRTVLIDEALQSGVDDLDLPAHACEPPCALDEIVPQVDYCPYHDIGLAAGDIIVNVGPLSGSPSRIPVVVDATPLAP